MPRKKDSRSFNTYTINVVISSGGGGSDNVNAPCIVNELLKNNENVIVIVTGNMESEKVAVNTFKDTSVLCKY